MAILAPQDWHLPKDHAMESSASNSSNSAVPRQHSGSSTTNPALGPPLPHLPSQYPYPVQQQQAGWTPNHSAPPFYPSFYQNPQLHPPFAHQNHPQQTHLPQNPYFDHAANHQFAQWAYQQMMFNAQQGHQMPHFSHSASQGSQRSRPGNGNTHPDYHLPSPTFGGFQGSTPPPHHASGNFTRSSSADSQPTYNGFHPYRRPDRQVNRDSPQPVQADWRSGAAGPFQPPYARNEASGSTTSVNSVSSQNSRHRTNSFQGSASGHGNTTKDPQSNRQILTNGSLRSGSNGPSTASSVSNPPTNRPHYRTLSSSSTSSNTARTPTPSSAGPSSTSVISASTSSSQANSAPRPVKPSPLSQGNFTAAEKRMSRDDSDLAAMMESTPTVSTGRSGLKGRLRRALSFNASNVLQEEDEQQLPAKGKSSQGKAGVAADKLSGTSDGPDANISGQKKKSRTALFNSRLNASTDNISLSSTMSSASMVIRKLGSIGKLTRRNSLAGITSLFKDKKDKEDAGDGKNTKKNKTGKGVAAEASVSHVTAELDRSEWSAELNGLSPAARLARQHTLRTNAEAAAKANVIQEPAASVTPPGEDSFVPPTWEKNSTTRPGEVSTNGFVNEEGTRIVVEEDDASDSDDDKMEGPSHRQDLSGSLEGWDDTDDWGEDDEDVTIRVGVESINLDNEDDLEMEPWAVDVRRSIEKKRTPMKSILKTSVQTAEQPSARLRSNSYNSAPSYPSELGPLARIPSSDPDHIDGLHNHAHVSAPTPNTAFLPPLSFQPSDSQKDLSDNSSSSLALHEKSMFSHSNSSAPVLSAVLSSNTPTLSHRSATAPIKRLAFASNLSVYDTFPPSVYDRRSEPATWSRLTPALAQRIKEELNSYKMEEMEVHASSRIHTQFFV